jgi:TonB family protein
MRPPLEVCLQAEEVSTMHANHSTERPGHEYQPTIIEHRLLLSRLASQVAFLKNEFIRDPVGFAKRSGRDLLSAPNTIHAVVAIVTAVVMMLLLHQSAARSGAPRITAEEPPPEMVVIDLGKLDRLSAIKESSGKDGAGRVGFQKDKGEGSGDTPKHAQGGGSGGNGTRIPPQTGKLPPPSAIPAAIPIAPPIAKATLPVAGIDIDPALWKDLKAPVYGDPNSKSEIPSKGPGEGEGLGDHKGTGVGTGSGPGAGTGDGGNTGGNGRQIGCCGSGGGSDRDGRPFTGREVEQRARLIAKPEPQYTEEARRNQITGTVMLRVVFSSAGEVVQIRAVNTLPFGLTERAIAAARQIKFIPAMKGGRPVSVYMQLEYNFNLY